MITVPLHFVHNVEAAVHDEGVHPPGFGAEAGNPIPALLGGTEFKFEKGVVFRAHDAEIVGHKRSPGAVNFSTFIVEMMPC